VNLLGGDTILKPTPLIGLVPMFEISRRLVFKMVKADTYAEPKVLKKSKTLVAFDKYGESQHIAPKMPSGQDATVLMWLDNSLAKRGSK
jgi:hypothetical protein